MKYKPTLPGLEVAIRCLTDADWREKYEVSDTLQLINLELIHDQSL